MAVIWDIIIKVQGLQFLVRVDQGQTIMEHVKKEIRAAAHQSEVKVSQVPLISSIHKSLTSQGCTFHLISPTFINTLLYHQDNLPITSSR